MGHSFRHLPRAVWRSGRWLVGWTGVYQLFLSTGWKSWNEKVPVHRRHHFRVALCHLQAKIHLIKHPPSESHPFWKTTMSDFYTCAGDEKETSDEELRQILVNHSRHAQSEPEEEATWRKESWCRQEWKPSMIFVNILPICNQISWNIMNSCIFRCGFAIWTLMQLEFVPGVLPLKLGQAIFGSEGGTETSDDLVIFVENKVVLYDFGSERKPRDFSWTKLAPAVSQWYEGVSSAKKKAVSEYLQSFAFPKLRKSLTKLRSWKVWKVWGPNRSLPQQPESASPDNNLTRVPRELFIHLSFVNNFLDILSYWLNCQKNRLCSWGIGDPVEFGNAIATPAIPGSSKKP